MIYNVIKPPASLVKLAQRLLAEHVKPGDIVIDATVGNGHDTQFLLGLVQSAGMVYGFDIQETALNIARLSLQASPYFPRLKLLQVNHADMASYLPNEQHGKISAIMFNLGYLPGGEKNIITQADSTITALTCASQLLAAFSILTVLAYPGHAGGDLEAAKIKEWCEQLNPQEYLVNLYETTINNPAAPKLFVVNKLV